MSEVTDTDFYFFEDRLKESELLKVTAEYDDSKRILNDLIEQIALDTPEPYQYDEELSDAASDVAVHFTEFSLSLITEVGLSESKDFIARTWLRDDIESSTQINQLTSCDCVEAFDIDDITEIIEEITMKAATVDELDALLLECYAKNLSINLSIFANHVEKKRISLQSWSETGSSNREFLKAKAAEFSKNMAYVALGGLLVKALFKERNS